MKLKLDCPCGTRFAFEFEPVNGRVPGAVICPKCGHDGTQFTNYMLSQMPPETPEAPATPAATPTLVAPIATPGANPAAKPVITPIATSPGLKLTPAHAATPPPATPAAPAPPAATPAAAPAPAVKPGLSLSRSHAPAVPPALPASAETPGASAPAAGGSLSISRGHKGPQGPPPGAPPIPAHLANSTGPAASSSSISSTAEKCSKHPRETTTNTCFICKKPICPKCMEIFGFLCSATCRHTAERNKVVVPACPYKKSEVDSKMWGKVARVGGAIAAVLALLIGVLVWYEFVGSQPRVFYTVNTGKVPVLKARLLDENRLLVVDAQEMSLHDLKTKKAIWKIPMDMAKNNGMVKPELTPEQKTAIAAQRKKAARLRAAEGGASQQELDEIDKKDFSKDEEGDDEPFSRFRFGPKPRIHFVGDDVWICFERKLECFDLKTGQSKKSVDLPGWKRGFSASDNALLAVSMTQSNTQVLTRVSLPDGNATTEEIAGLKRDLVEVKKNIAPGAEPTSQVLLKRELEGDEKSFRNRVNADFLVAGPNLVEFETKLLEAKEVTVQAMKPASGESKVNSNLRASSNLKAVAEDVFNELKRSNGGGYRTEDVSTYQVTLRRLPAGAAPEWTGEVTGRPRLYPLKTVDVLIAGKSLHVFDKNNKLLAKGTLAFDTGFGYGGLDDEDSSSSGPCLENGNMLYVFDQGVLTAMELPSGEVKWRVTTVGVTGVLPDGKGALYVNTSTASAESIKYSEQISMDKDDPVIMKVDIATGKILWQVQSRGGVTHFENKMLFTREQHTSSIGPNHSSDHFRIYRLKPGNGKDVFEYYHKGFPEESDFKNTRIALTFANEVKVLKFLTF